MSIPGLCLTCFNIALLVSAAGTGGVADQVRGCCRGSQCYGRRVIHPLGEGNESRTSARGRAPLGCISSYCNGAGQLLCDIGPMGPYIRPWLG